MLLPHTPLSISVDDLPPRFEALVKIGISCHEGASTNIQSWWPLICAGANALQELELLNVTDDHLPQYGDCTAAPTVFRIFPKLHKLRLKSVKTDSTLASKSCLVVLASGAPKLEQLAMQAIDVKVALWLSKTAESSIMHVAIGPIDQLALILRTPSEPAWSRLEYVYLDCSFEGFLTLCAENQDLSLAPADIVTQSLHGVWALDWQFLPKSIRSLSMASAHAEIVFFMMAQLRAAGIHIMEFESMHILGCEHAHSFQSYLTSYALANSAIANGMTICVGRRITMTEEGLVVVSKP